MSRLKVEDLNKIQKEKHKINKQIYKTILEDSEKKIKYNNSLGNTTAVITIPYMKLGYPIYNVTHAMMYVTRKLTKQGFQIHGIQENKIYVNWKIKKEPQPPVKLKGILRKK